MEWRARAELVTLLTVSTCIAALSFGRAILMPVAVERPEDAHRSAQPSASSPSSDWPKEGGRP